MPPLYTADFDSSYSIKRKALSKYQLMTLPINDSVNFSTQEIILFWNVTAPLHFDNNPKSDNRAIFREIW